jgi:hypothetical protein
LQILKIVLWPFSEAFEPRQIGFKENVVNVVSGIAKTGKSALIPIIDYCLGAEKCTIPVRVIRNTCEWFGVVVATSEGQKLFARRNPGDQRSTGDMYILEGAQIEVPRRIQGRNASVDSIKRKLDELSGLSSLQPDPDAPNNSRPSFRDLAAFNFQPQNIVANPNVLFFKVDSNEHREEAAYYLSIYPGRCFSRSSRSQTGTGAAAKRVSKTLKRDGSAEGCVRAVGGRD